MKYHIHTKALLTNTEGKILLLKRSDSQQWDLPGGKVEVPELAKEAILREIQEETWINHAGEIHCDFSYTAHGKDNDTYFILLLFKAETNASSIAISDEHSDYLWAEEDYVRSTPMTSWLANALTLYYAKK